MHLPIRVPNIWYRAVYEWTDPDPHVMVGATLPGHPAMVIGSNTSVAWGFTNTWGDFTDVVLLDADPQRPDRYRTPEGWRAFDRYDEVIKVAGGADEHLAVAWTMWGPVIEPDHNGRARALSWVAHSADMLAGTMTPFEQARTLDQAFDEANGAGVPGQNMVAADRSGHIGWSIFGTLPHRVGTDGILPVSWADGAAGWRGPLARDEYPRIVDPPGRTPPGRPMPASARNGHATPGPRQLRHRGACRASFAIACSPGNEIRPTRPARRATRCERHVPPARWPRCHPAGADAVCRAGPSRLIAPGIPQRGRATLDRPGDGRLRRLPADARVSRARVGAPDRLHSGGLLARRTRRSSARVVKRREGPIWKLVAEQPAHLLDPAFATWQDLLVAGVDEAIARVRRDHPGPLVDRGWDEVNQTVYRHPLSGALPFLWRWLDMPRQSLPGDLFTPNMHWGANAPSERLIVSPGREQEGVMQMPTGQSGHPLSPYYANSHPAWIKGELTPLMPGHAEHSLTLVP